MLGVGLAMALAACGSPSYEYVRNTEARTAFKIPIDWTVFDEAALQGEAAGPPVNTPDPVEWLVGLDGDPSPVDRSRARPGRPTTRTTRRASRPCFA